MPASQKKCPKGKIVNPRTGRCVKRDGAIGKKLLASRKSSGKKSLPKTPKRPSRKSSEGTIKSKQAQYNKVNREFKKLSKEMNKIWTQREKIRYSLDSEGGPFRYRKSGDPELQRRFKDLDVEHKIHLSMVYKASKERNTLKKQLLGLQLKEVGKKLKKDGSSETLLKRKRELEDELSAWEPVLKKKMDTWFYASDLN